jgi:hypothetical protein
MTFALFIFLWWLSGFLVHMWMTWDGVFTWADLLGCIMMGSVGPIYFLVVAVTIGGTCLAQADFWNKPIFGKRSKPINYKWD